MFDYIIVVHDELFDPDSSFKWDDGVLMFFPIECLWYVRFWGAVVMLFDW